MKFRPSQLAVMIKEELDHFYQNHGTFAEEIDPTAPDPTDPHPDVTNPGRPPTVTPQFAEVKKLENALMKVVQYINGNNIMFPQRQEAIRNIQNAMMIIKKASSGSPMGEDMPSIPPGGQ